MIESHGGCACGRARYRMLAPPMIVHACHCSLCRVSTGGPCAVNALIESEHVGLISGSVAPAERPTGSGRKQVAWCCADCRTMLWANYGSFREHVRFVRAATLDDPTAFPLAAHIFTRSMLPWVALPPGVPAFEAMYDIALVWPAESLRRRHALLDRIAAEPAGDWQPRS